MRICEYFLYILFSFTLCTKSQNLKKIKKEGKTIISNFTLFYKTNIKCTKVNCPSPNFCNDLQDTCYCAKGYVNIYNNINSEIYCSYKQYKQLNSFLLELFTNFGIGHLIIGNFISGIIKIILSLFLYILCGLQYWNNVIFKQKKNEIKITFGIYISFLCSFIWWIVDAFCFGFNKYNDINNIPLMQW